MDASPISEGSGQTPPGLNVESWDPRQGPGSLLTCFVAGSEDWVNKLRQAHPWSSWAMDKDQETRVGGWGGRLGPQPGEKVLACVFEGHRHMEQPVRPQPWQPGVFYLEDHQLALEDGEEVGRLAAHGHVLLNQGSMVHEVQLLSIVVQGLYLVCGGLMTLQVGVMRAWSSS